MGKRMERWEGMPNPPLPVPFSSRKNPLWPSVPDPAHSSLGSWVPTIMAEVRTLEGEGNGGGGCRPRLKVKGCPSEDDYSGLLIIS